MREYTSCKTCHRTIDPDFRFCPHCGTERIRNYHFRELLDESFGSMDKAAQVYTFKKLIQLEGRLLNLETDLDHFLDPINTQ